MAKPVLGNKVKDKITGFSGFVTGVVEYITGCRQLLVQPPMKKSGDFVEGRYFDEDRLEVLKGGISLNVERDGFDVPAPRK